MAVDLLMDALADTIRGIPTNIGVGVLEGVEINMFVGVMTAFELATTPLP